MIWSLVETIVANTALAAILAIPAWFVGRRTRYQAVAHLLWLIVLLKLLTPPLVPLRIPAPAFASSWMAPAPTVAKSPAAEAPATKNTASNSAAAAAPVPKIASKSKGTSKVSTKENRAAADKSIEVAPSLLSILGRDLQVAAKATIDWFASLGPLQWFVLALAVGTAVWFGRQILALRRFARMLSHGKLPSDDVIDLAREAANVFNCEKLPRIRVLDLPITPMLWGLGPWTTLLMPARLDHHISRESLKSLVAHELAHYIRGDSWVRLAEFIATGLLWWNPIVWLARHELERSEEQCCDAMVVARSGARPRTYAQAILDAIDYVCETPMPLPPVASGLATAKFLEHRITMIMKRGVDATLAKWGRTAVALSVLVMLPWTPRIIAASKSDFKPPLPVLAKTPEPSAINPIVKVVIAKPRRVDPDESFASSGELKSPTKEWTGANLRPDMPKDQPWTLIEAPIGNLAVEISSKGELRWASPSFSSTQPPFTESGILAVVWSPDGNHLFTAGSDGYVRAWKAPQKAGTNEEILAQGISSRSLTTLDLSYDGIHVAIGDALGRVWILNSEKGDVRQLSRGGDAVASVRFSPDGGQLVVTRGAWLSSHQPVLEVIHVESKRVVKRITLSQPAATAEWTADSEFLAVASWGGWIDYYDPDGQLIGFNQLEKRDVVAWAFSSTSSRLREMRPSPADLEFGADTFDGMVSEGIAPAEPIFVQPAPATSSFLDFLLNSRPGN